MSIAQGFHPHFKYSTTQQVSTVLLSTQFPMLLGSAGCVLQVQHPSHPTPQHMYPHASPCFHSPFQFQLLSAPPHHTLHQHCPLCSTLGTVRHSRLKRLQNNSSYKTREFHYCLRYNSSAGSWVSLGLSGFCWNPLSFKRSTIACSSNSAMATR